MKDQGNTFESVEIVWRFGYECTELSFRYCETFVRLGSPEIPGDMIACSHVS